MREFCSTEAAFQTVMAGFNMMALFKKKVLQSDAYTDELHQFDSNVSQKEAG